MPYRSNKDRKRYQAAYNKVNRQYLNKKRDDRFETNRRYVVEYLRSHPCAVCGEKDILVLDFDHVDRGTKDRTINHAIKEFGLQKLKEEIAKCEVLCANDHRRKTARQLNSFRLRLMDPCIELVEDT